MTKEEENFIQILLDRIEQIAKGKYKLEVRIKSLEEQLKDLHNPKE